MKINDIKAHTLKLCFGTWNYLKEENIFKNIKERWGKILQGFALIFLEKSKKLF